MAHKDGNESDGDESRGQMVQHESASAEEVRMLRQQMADMYQAWMNGQAPPSSIPGFPDVTMSIPIETSTSDPLFPPGFGPHVNISNTSGTSTVRPPNAPLRNNPLFIPTVQTTTIPQPTLQYSSPVEIEKTAKNEEQEEMARKMKSLEQSVRNMQGLEGPKSVSFRDLCMFPNVHLPLGFKTPKFEKYDGHGDPVAHLKKYYNQLRGAGSKE
ncbi:uncharacterized protein LOC132037186 [Lycium ferocissimum]|uniref:uncharacterized protein LOC132037186 n=1 Tax=Lycium ferocissimum TaxID=112874 RepID=UPI002815E4EF|nr:uncharacterized protein LOC132037186 [Lycium ferocissimum]